MELVQPASDLLPAKEPFRWRHFLRKIAPELVLLAILVAGAWLRFPGRNWDENQHLHPDERFLTMVETSIRIPASVGEYFNTGASPLNPNNVGHTFFVYGTLPIFVVRFLAQRTGDTGYDEMVLLGRTVSAAFDLLTILFVYLIGSRLYRRRVGLLAAAFTAFSVLLIQHAHFFVVESFTVAFVAGGFYFAVRAMDTGGWSDHLFFGLFLGMAAASKIDSITLAGVLVLASLIRLTGVDPDRRVDEAAWALLKLVAAGFVTLLAFRVFQPYAFAGPTFFGVKPNPSWLAALSELSRQAGGGVDFPPALQWANRTPVLFAWKNMVLWGLGLPLGLAAWAGWALAAVGIARWGWRHNLLPVVWTGAYFLWRSVGFTPSMRYQLPVYPTLALLAAWGLWEGWEAAGRASPGRRRILRPLAGAAGLLVLLGTAAWAVAFAGIYNRPMPRVEATRWIYSHVPAVVNLIVDVEGERLLDPIAVSLDLTLASDEPVDFDFIDNLPGNARAIVAPGVIDLTPELGPRTLTFRIQDNPDPASLIATAVYTGPLPTSLDQRLEIPFDAQPPLFPGHTYYANVELSGGGAVILRGELELRVTAAGGDQAQSIGLPRETLSLASSAPYEAGFSSQFAGQAQGVLLAHPFNATASGGEQVVMATLLHDVGNGPEPLAVATYTGVLSAEDSPLELSFDQPVGIEEGRSYGLRLEMQGGGALVLRGSVIINESTWDDGLPLRLGGLDINGRYAAPMLELYWPDDLDADQTGVSDKLERFVTQLTQGDLLVISSNRQYGTTSRVPIRYPLTTAYYRALFDCPEPESVVACGARAMPQPSANSLGWQLIAVFENNPRLGPIEINDQLAEEAFTVYDHPRVLLFAPTPSYSAADVRELLGAVDLSQVVHVLPGEAGAIPPSLMLPRDRWDAQRVGGTWSEAFHPASILNRYPFVAVIVWWLAIALLGAIALPITRVAFPGLADGGYPLARIVGLIVVAWGAWMLGSVEVPFGRASILLVLLATAGLSLALALRDREGLKAFLRSRRKEILFTEALALAFFLLDLAIRLGNPDLWHPSKGGEKPMDLSYLTAVLRSTSFPPYDPWFAGGYINYYYYGFVLIGIPMRLLGIMPTVGYNLAIPTLFALLALAAYCVAHNLVARFHPLEGNASSGISPRLAGVAAAVSIVVLGNLGTVRMIYEGLKRIGTPEGQETGTALVGVVQAARGAARFVTMDTGLPYGLDSWYWDPSRAIPPAGGEPGPITEFPFFTFLYGDLHAHMISRPVAVLCLAWMLSWLLAADRRKQLRLVDLALALGVGGLAFGALRPTNLGDYPTYWGMAAVAAAAAPWLRERRLTGRVVAESILYAALLLGLSYLLYFPYYHWYGQAYGEVSRWTGSRTPLSAYFTVHGLFLFAILSWMVLESIQWMAATPLSALTKLRPYLGLIGAVALILAVGTVFLAAQGYVVAVIVVPTTAWAGVLFLRPGQPLEKRLALTLYAAGAALTLLVEIVVIVGDIGRMNTVFKFYLQVWELFGVAGAAALFWLLSSAPTWRPSVRQVWGIALGALVFSAALYPILASIAKVRDRWEPGAPHSLDGIAFMPFVTYHDIGSTTLEEDAAAIRWLQEEVEGTPVIVEAHIPEYRWGSRMTIYTGLPSVLGWNWHQRQQRVLEGDMEVWERAWDIEDFYLTRSIEEARAFLEEYQVGYIIVGRLERMYYESLQPCAAAGSGVSCDMSGRVVMRDCSNSCLLEIPPTECTALDPQGDPATLACPSGGLEKFEQMVQMGLLRVAFQEGQSAIYEVIR